MHDQKFDPSKPVVISAPVPTSNPSHNATRHGCCSLDTLILPNENLADFNALKSSWQKSYTTTDATETNLLDQLVTSDWLLQRSIRTLTEIESQIFSAEPNPLNWTDDHHKAITRFQRYRTANQNFFNKCRKTLDDYRKTRITGVRTEEKHKIYILKSKPKPTIEESLQLMREKAIALGLRPGPVDVAAKLNEPGDSLQIRPGT